MEESNRILVQRWARQGDAEALSAIMRQYAGMVYGTCRRVLGDDAQAADVAQETFFLLLKNAQHVTGSLGSWLHQVATRRAIDLIRQNTSRRRREETYAASILHETDQWQEIEPLVDEALEEMPDDLREVLIRHYLKGQSMTEIALAQGLSQPTISRRVATALEQLRYNLRARGVTVGLAILGGMLVNSAQAAPMSLLHSLGKMVLAHQAMTVSTTSPIVAAGVKAALTAAAITVVAGTGWFVWHRTIPEPRPAPARAIASPSSPMAVTTDTPRIAADPEPDNLTATVAVQPPASLAQATSPPMTPSANGPIVDPGTYTARPGGSPTRGSGARSQSSGRAASGGSAGGFAGGSGGSLQPGSRAVAPGFPPGMPRSGFGAGGQGSLPPAQWGGQISIGGGGGGSFGGGGGGVGGGGGSIGGGGGVTFPNQGGGFGGVSRYTTNYSFGQTEVFPNRRSWSTQSVFSGSAPFTRPRGR